MNKNNFIGSSPFPKISVAIVDAWNARHQVGDKIIFIDDNANSVRPTITGPVRSWPGAAVQRWRRLRIGAAWRG
jgi:hypothetical protein